MNTILDHALTGYEVLTKEAPFVSGIHSEADYENALSFIEEFMAAVGDNPDDHRWPLFELVVSVVDKYEISIEPELAIEEEDPVAVIRVLMDQHGLRQSELPEIGSQGVVSEILNGRRQLNVNQIKALSERFNVPSNLFV